MRVNVLEGPDKGRDFTVDPMKPCVFGRDPHCTVHLQDPESSRQHVRFYVEHGRVFVEDLKSRNGTALNGEPIGKAALAEGDRILIGRTVIQVADLPDIGPGDQTATQREALSDRVLLSLRHDEADLLSNQPGSVTSSEILHENRILRKVCEISNVVASGREPKAILEGVLDRVKTILEADAACVLVWSDEAREWCVHATTSDTTDDQAATVSRTIIQEAVNEGMAILSDNPMGDSRFAAAESIVSHRITSAVCAPMKIEDAFKGILFVHRCNSPKALNSMDLRFAATVANVVGVLLEKVKFQEEFVKQERLAAVGEVIAGLAHYAKNIITGLRLSVGMLQRVFERKQYDAASQCLDSLAVEERRLSDLILDMLSYAREREPVRDEVDVRQVLEEVMTPYRRSLEEDRIEFELQCDDCPMIRADRTALHRSFLNLLGNALDAVRDKEEGAREVRVRVQPAADGGVEIRIADTGCGIAEADVSRIFTVFFSTKGSRGTGLGLAVTHKIIQEHGGTISVTSTEGKGTEFLITLPADG